MSVEAIYKEYKDHGLEVMWIIGEDKEKNLPSIEWCQDFKDKKGATFPVLRDYKFYQTYGAIAQHSNSLPHQYILDGQTMELLFATGGQDPDAEVLLNEILGQL